MELVPKILRQNCMKKLEKESLENKPKRQRETVGSVIQIRIDNGYYVYAQILRLGQYVFFDYRSQELLKDLSVLNSANILFILSVDSYPVNVGRWLKVGKLPIRIEFENLPNKYIFDKFKREFSLYITETGEILPSTKGEVRGLEQCAVWGENHVVDRIRDYYNKVPCKWLQTEYELFQELKPY